MKTKFLTVLAMLMCATLLSAQTFNRIYVNIQQGSATDQVRLFETPSFTENFENGYDETKLSENSAIYIYAMGLNQKNVLDKQVKLYTNDLQGQVLGYQAASAGSATITFSYLRSDLADVTTYFLLDTEEGVYTQIGEGSSDKYVFTAAAGDHPNRFIILKPVKVTTNEDGWASFANNVALAPLGGLKAYYAEYDAANTAVDLHETDMIPAAEGVFLYGNALTEYSLTPNVSGLSASAEQNDLVGCVSYTDVSGVSDAIYCLRNVSGETALYQYTGANIPAGKAYLPVTVSGPNPAPKHISLRFNGTNAINNVEAETVKAEKFVENGEIFIRRGNEVYNLQGQKVNF